MDPGPIPLSPVEYGFILVVALAMIALAWVPAWGHRLALRQLKASRRWRSVEGQVRSVVVRDSSTLTADYLSFTSFALDVTYAYSVDGRKYSGSRRYFGDEHEVLRSEAAVERAKAGLVEGAKVSVFYDPNRISESTLSRTAPAAVWPRRLALTATAGILAGTLPILLTLLFRG